MDTKQRGNKNVKTHYNIEKTSKNTKEAPQGAGTVTP